MGIADHSHVIVFFPPAPRRSGRAIKEKQDGRVASAIFIKKKKRGLQV
jgi:hypothetical protein